MHDYCHVGDRLVTQCQCLVCWIGNKWCQVFRSKNFNFRASFRLETCKIWFPTLNGTCWYLRHCGSSTPLPPHTTITSSKSPLGQVFSFLRLWVGNFSIEIPILSTKSETLCHRVVFVSCKYWKLVYFRVSVPLSLRAHGWIGSSHRVGRRTAEDGGTLGHGRSLTF